MSPTTDTAGSAFLPSTRQWAQWALTVSAHRTAWHFFFVILLRKHGPRWLEVREEAPEQVMRAFPPEQVLRVLRRANSC